MYAPFELPDVVGIHRAKAASQGFDLQVCTFGQLALGQASGVTSCSKSVVGDGGHHVSSVSDPVLRVALLRHFT
ncbi:hypothetical protein ACFPM7_27995 [Actinokineospora guangxiensis]|uniref:Uncharacterized protein n=1 Tax=Actinokineospora guangxiensis TaxID=1490288 RepID=A0ABW0EXK3_9PSEU